MKINILSLLVLFITSFILSACQNKNTATPFENNDYVVSDATPASSQTSQSTPEQGNQNAFVAINTDYGQIVIELFSQVTPNTVKNFLDKVDHNYYDGLIFHRVVPQFVVQGGDPTGTGTGGGDIKSELNQIPFEVGSLGLARTPDTKEISNDSQFFICLTTQQCAQLTGDYVNFGRVVTGMDVVQKIKVGDTINSIVTTTK